jgi:hypothetical protein
VPNMFKSLIIDQKWSPLEGFRSLGKPFCSNLCFIRLAFGWFPPLALGPLDMSNVLSSKVREILSSLRT